MWGNGYEGGNVFDAIPALLSSDIIKIKTTKAQRTLKIIDNRKGFDIANSTKGNGMFNMKKRAEMLKGALTVISTVGEGTTIQLSFKL